MRVLSRHEVTARRNAQQEAAELVVLVDEAGRAIGTADKARVHGVVTPLHLAFSAYLFDAAGQVLVTRRALDKRTFPGVWTNSVCGHPAPGESLPEAVRRRAQLELGVSIDSLRLVLPRFRYRATMTGVEEHELCPVYAGWLAEGATPTPSADEVSDTRWVDWDRFVDDVSAGTWEVSPWCHQQLPQLTALDADPRRWPVGDEGELPSAARSH